MDDSNPTEQISRPHAVPHTPSDQPSPVSPLRPGVVFISHEKTDDGLAREIRAHLEAGGFACWMAPDDVAGPTPWPEQIEAAIESCDVMLIVVSANASGSAHVAREVDLAVERAKPLLPVRVEDVAPTGTLNYLLRLAQWIDLFPGSIADHAVSLQGMVGSMLAERGIAPPAAPSPRRSRRKLRIPRTALVGLAAAALVAGGVGIGLILAGNDQGSSERATVDVAGESEPLVAEQPGEGEPLVSEEPGGSEPLVSEQGDESALGAAENETIFRVSVASDGTQGDGHSVNPVISADGRYVAFDSMASNLVDGDTNGNRDVFVHDRETGETTRVSQVVFGDRVEEAEGASHDPQISADGRYIAFASDATNLDPDYEQTSPGDIYLHDRETGRNSYISFMPNGQEHPSESIDPDMSDDGTLIAYATYPGGQLAPGGVPAAQGEDGRPPVYTVWVHDTTTGATTLVAEFDMTREGASVSPPAVTPDGSLVVTSELHSRAFIFERDTGSVTKLDGIPDVEGGLLPYPDGERFVFPSFTPGLVPDDVNGFYDIFVYDRSIGEYTMILELAPDFWTSPSSISSDGRYIAMATQNGQSLVLDTLDGSTVQLSNSLGLDRLELSGDGRSATFSTSSGLVDGDTNGQQDVYVMELPE